MSKIQEIEDAKRVVGQISKGLDYITNPSRRATKIEQANTIIKLINGAERMALNNIDAELFKVMYLGLFQHYYRANKPDDQERLFMSIETLKHRVLQQIDSCLAIGSQQLLSELAEEIAIDAVNASDQVPERLKEMPVDNPEAAQLVNMLADLKADYTQQLQGFCNTCFLTYKKWS